jgi:peptide deformylase
MYEDLKIILWPDPRLIKVSKPVETFDDNLRALAAKMFELMREARGVGLAAPQVGENIRLFVMNHDGDPAHDRVYVNPVLTDADGEEEGEEGCLSLPKVNINVWRNRTLKVTAKDLEGKPFEQIETGYLARIWQHETDHLNGVLLTDRMGPVARMANRKILKELEEKYAAEHPSPPTPKPPKRKIKK